MEGGNQAEVEETSSQDSPNKVESSGEEVADDGKDVMTSDSPPESSKDSPSAISDTTPSEEVEVSTPEASTPEDIETEAVKVEPPEKVAEESSPKEPEPTESPALVNGGGGDSEEDREKKSEPFQPWYKAQVTSAVKDGEHIIFRVETVRLDESSKQFKVDRLYEDFEWLHHCLTTDNDIGGIVTPPLPIKPVATAADAAAKSRKELGETSRTLKGGEFEKDSRRLEKYLQTVIKHSVFGRDPVLAKFLTESDPPARAKLRKNYLNNFTKAMEGVLKGNLQDVDETFQKHRLNATNMVPLTREMSVNFQGVVNHSERLSGALNHFSTALCLVSSANSNKSTAQMNEMQLTFARSMERLAHAVSVYATNDERTLGFTLDLYSKYAESVKEMLGRRTVKLYEYNSAVKTYEKAKPLKKQAAEEVKNQREKDFKAISEVAAQELSQYKKQRIIDFQQALVLYAEAKIKTARDAYALLAKDLSSIKTMEMDGS